MALQPVQRRSVSDAVFEQLLEGVLAGELAPGSTLPAERTLTSVLGVNRQAVREALQRLAQAGVLDIRHGEATEVVDYRLGAGLDLLPRLLVRPDGTVDADAVRALLELRLCLGPEIARRCAERASAGTRTGLRALVEEMAAADGDLAALATLDLRFWDILVEGADNIAYRLAFNGLRRTYEPIADLLADVLADELTDHAGHRAVKDAVEAGDGPAARAAAERLLARGERAVSRLVAGLTAEAGS